MSVDHHVHFCASCNATCYVGTTKANLTTPAATAAVVSPVLIKGRLLPTLRPPRLAACQLDSAVMIEFGSTNQRKRFDDACRCNIKRRQLLLTASTMTTKGPSIRRTGNGVQHSMSSTPTAGAAAATTNLPMTRSRHSSTRGRGRRRPVLSTTTTAIRALHLAVALLALAGRLVPVQGAGGDLGSRSDWQHPGSRDRRGNKAGGSGSGRGRREARRGYAGAFPRRERGKREGAVVSEDDGGGGWSRRRKGSESMREIVEVRAYAGRCYLRKRFLPCFCNKCFSHEAASKSTSIPCMSMTNYRSPSSRGLLRLG